MKCGFPMVAQISFAHMFSLPLWNFQCSDEIFFVSARLLWFMICCQRKSFQIIPWIWILFSKTYLIEQNTWIWRMPGNLHVFFWKGWKMKNTKHNFWNFPTTKQKKQCSTNLNLSPTKLHGRSFEKNSCSGMRATVREFLAFFSGVAATLLLTLATDGDRDSPISCREPS